MKKIFGLLFVLFAAVSFAQTGYAPAVANATSCKNVTITGACTAFSLPLFQNSAPSSFTWQTYFDTGAAATFTVNFEGSIDGTRWYVLDSSSALAGEGRHIVYKPVKYVRCNVTTYTLGTSNNVSCTFIANAR